MGKLKTLKGSTLVEVLVAMIIIMLSFGISVMIIHQVFGSNRNRMRLKAFAETKQKAIETKINHDYKNEEYVYPLFIIHKQVYEYPKEKKLQVLEFKITDTTGNLWFTKKELIKIPRENKRENVFDDGW